MTSEVAVAASDGLARLTLNRPQALHALNTEMCEAMIAALLAWRDDDTVGAVVIEHAPGTRGFCAGGDIRRAASDAEEARRFFRTEYQLNHLLFDYPKPVVAIMDGVAMGGGAGLAMPARVRVATENTLFAMPEAGIGLFPDVGAGWWLARLPGKIGLWLALTGARLKAGDCIAAGIATDYVEAADLGEVGAQGLSALPISAASAPEQLTPEDRARIDRLFAGESVEAIFAALEADGSDWARDTLATLQTKSPQTLKVAFRLLREGAARQSFADEMRAEYRVAVRVSARPDFREGVRAVLLDKDNAPRWEPQTLAGVTEAVLDEIFAPLPEGEEWTPLPEIS